MNRSLRPLAASTLPTNAEVIGAHPSEHKMDVRVVVITPALAKQWLDRSRGNRPINPNRVNLYGRDMTTTGAWIITGQPIIFSERGALVDGHHRLAACVTTNTAFRSLVVWGASPRAYEAIDRGQTRSNSQVLALAGVSSSKVLSPVLAMICKEKRGIALTTAMTVSVSEQTDELAANPELEMSLKYAQGARGAGYTASAAVYCHYLLAKVNRPDADAFFERLYKLTDLPEGSPILALSKQLGNVRGDMTMVRAYTVKAWNAYRCGLSVSKLQMGPKERIPMPK